MERETLQSKIEKLIEDGEKAKADITRTEACNLFCVEVMKYFPHISEVDWSPFGDHAVEFSWTDHYNKNPGLRVSMILPTDNILQTIKHTVEVMNGNNTQRKKGSSPKT